MTIKMEFGDPSFVTRDDTLWFSTNFYEFESNVARNETSIPCVVQLDEGKK